MHRSFPTILPLCTLVTMCLLPFAERDLWFDEALTVLNFALLPDMGAIYRSYVIPNNQIVHTCLLHFWMKLVPAVPLFLRLLPVLTAVLTTVLLFCRFRRRCGSWILTAVLASWVISPAFAVYGTALRGYMLSSLWITLALRTAENCLVYGRKRDWTGFALFSLLAAGTIPTNLLGLEAAVLYVCPFAGKRFFRDGRIWILAGIPPAAMALFYFPVLSAFLGCCRLGEGWNRHWAAGWAGTLPFAVCFALPAALGLYAEIVRGRMRDVRNIRGILWFLPLAACLFLPTAPFPRTFFPLWPLFAVLAASGLKNFAAGKFFRKYRNRRWPATLLGAPVICWGALGNVSCVKLACSRMSGGENADDYFLAYYMTPDFCPSGTAVLLKGEDPEWQRGVYCSFCADPWSLLYALLQQGAPGDYCRFDGPRGAVSGISEGAQAVLRHDEPPQDLEKRFGRRMEFLRKAGRNCIYRVCGEL